MSPRKNLRPTLKDVAALAGVSAQTVSFVVNRNPVISAETRERVLAAIRELGSTDEPALLARVYDDVPERMHPMALRSLRAHLIKLRGEGRAQPA